MDPEPASASGSLTAGSMSAWPDIANCRRLSLVRRANNQPSEFSHRAGLNRGRKIGCSPWAEFGDWHQIRAADPSVRVREIFMGQNFGTRKPASLAGLRCVPKLTLCETITARHNCV
jgi:hypothetical protein